MELRLLVQMLRVFGEKRNCNEIVPQQLKPFAQKSKNIKRTQKRILEKKGGWVDERQNCNCCRRVRGRFAASATPMDYMREGVNANALQRWRMYVWRKSFKWKHKRHSTRAGHCAWGRWWKKRENENVLIGKTRKDAWHDRHETGGKKDVVSQCIWCCYRTTGGPSPRHYTTRNHHRGYVPETRNNK